MRVERQLSFFSRSTPALARVQPSPDVPAEMVCDLGFEEAIAVLDNGQQTTHLIPPGVRIRVRTKRNSSIEIDVTNCNNVLVTKIPRGKRDKLSPYSSGEEMEVYYGVYGGSYKLPPGTIFGLHQTDEAVER